MLLWLHLSLGKLIVYVLFNLFDLEDSCSVNIFGFETSLKAVRLLRAGVCPLVHFPMNAASRNIDDVAYVTIRASLLL